jgi:hypothetical protein
MHEKKEEVENIPISFWSQQALASRGYENRKSTRLFAKNCTFTSLVQK